MNLHAKIQTLIGRIAHTSRQLQVHADRRELGHLSVMSSVNSRHRSVLLKAFTGYWEKNPFNIMIKFGVFFVCVCVRAQLSAYSACRVCRKPLMFDRTISNKTFFFFFFI